MRLLVVPVLVPLFGAGVSLLGLRSLVWQRVVGVATTATALAAAIGLLILVENDGIVAHDAGGWPAPVGITLVADLAAAMFLVVSLAVILIVQLYAIGQGADTVTPRIAHPVYLVLAAGVSMSFLTGDLFNLFVAFEVMLISSYVLLTLGAGRDQIRAGMTYVVINVLASTLLLTAVTLVYAATGTVNLADLTVKFTELPEATQSALGLLLLAVFAIKAALFPFFFWLPDSYPTAPISVTAVFAGLLTKVGVYTMIRTTTILELDQLTGVLTVVAGITMVVGVVGAIAQDDVKRILSFHIISQVGYMIMGLAFYTVAGLAGAVLYVVHHIPVKTVLFLVGGLVENTTGTGALHRLGGLVRRAPVIAVLFAIPALSLAGMPPFSGFLAKLSLVEAGIEAEAYAVVAASLVASLLTIFSMSKIWAGVFWGRPDDPPPALATDGPTLRAPWAMTAATAAMVGLTLVVPLFAGTVYDLAERAAVDLLDSTAYVEAVGGRVGQ
ncbi:MAG: Na+/H+ antiporter subunit D [Acidimicrobiales bacterium]|nr:Na+/H+ antiporter subunit D [Acidimicrobiales bacterium]